MDPNPTSHAPHLHDAKIGSRCQSPLVARDCMLQLSPLLMDHPHVAVCLGIAGLKLHSPLVMLQGRVVLRGRGGGNDMAGGEAGNPGPNKKSNPRWGPAGLWAQ